MRYLLRRIEIRIEHQRVQTEEERETCTDRGSDGDPEVRGVHFNEAAERDQEGEHHHDQHEHGNDRPLRDIASTTQFARLSCFTLRANRNDTENGLLTTGTLLVHSQHFVVNVLFEIEFAWHVFFCESFFWVLVFS